MRKKFFSLVFAVTACCVVVVGCGSKEGKYNDPIQSTIRVTTVFAGEDGNAQNYKTAVSKFEEETGINVNDSSEISNESFKSTVALEFQTGAEPDVLFFFNGADSDPFIREEKVVSIEEIREEYPEYADNMEDELITASEVDGKKYAVPVNGYWEGLFCNKEVLEQAGVEVPGIEYTWDEFIEDCRKIKKAGFTPIAASLNEIPHYWWEYSVFNHTKKGTHLDIPKNINEGNGPGWVEAMKDIKYLYEQNFFPENTLTANDDETFSMFVGDHAAFLLDGSWKVGSIASTCLNKDEDFPKYDEDELNKYEITYVPSKGDRKATDIIGGLSMGYYITRKAWDNEEKRDAAVKFVEYMTTDEMVGRFAGYTPSALKNPVKSDKNRFNSLENKAIALTLRSTSITGAVQDRYNDECRYSTFDEMPLLVTGEVEIEDAVAEGLAVYAEQLE